MNTTAAALLPSCAAAQAAWRVLDTRFDPARLYTLWQNWLAMTPRPAVLHVVALCAQAPNQEALHALDNEAQRPLADELLAQWCGLLPGQHRCSLQGGQLQLTLCVGDLQPLLREQQFEADAVHLDALLPWNRWSLKALARCCRRGALVALTPTPAQAPAELHTAGFVWRKEALHYDPPWALKTARENLRTLGARPSNCVVVGAGLAGASVAAALARRGWQVQVVDAGDAPASGASGLPVGLLAPHVSTDDAPRSRLTRAGLRLMRAEAQRLLQPGQDWQASGVLERRVDGLAGLPADWPAAGQTMSRADASHATARWHAGASAAPEIWHAQAAWIKPAQLVRAWLRQPGVRFMGQAHVHALRRQGGQWQLLNREGQVLAQAAHLVLANAADAWRLLDGLASHSQLRDQIPAMHEMRGVLTMGLRKPGDEDALPSFPVNGLGSLIPAVPTHEGLAWCVGATYEAANEAAAPMEAHHQANLSKLQRLLPAAAQKLAAAFTPKAAHGWSHTRCVSADRFPLVGPLEDGPEPTLWISAAMGSRGLSFAMLCAELLAARMGAEPWPVQASLARFLHARRRASVQAPTTQAESGP